MDSSILVEKENAPTALTLSKPVHLVMSEAVPGVAPPAYAARPGMSPSRKPRLAFHPRLLDPNALSRSPTRYAPVGERRVSSGPCTPLNGSMEDVVHSHLSEKACEKAPQQESNFEEGGREEKPAVALLVGPSGANTLSNLKEGPREGKILYDPANGYASGASCRELVSPSATRASLGASLSVSSTAPKRGRAVSKPPSLLPVSALSVLGEGDAAGGLIAGGGRPSGRAAAPLKRYSCGVLTTKVWSAEGETEQGGTGHSGSDSQEGYRWGSDRRPLHLMPSANSVACCRSSLAALVPERSSYLGSMRDPSPLMLSGVSHLKSGGGSTVGLTGTSSAGAPAKAGGGATIGLACTLSARGSSSDALRVWRGERLSPAQHEAKYPATPEKRARVEGNGHNGGLAPLNGGVNGAAVGNAGGHSGGLDSTASNEAWIGKAEETPLMGNSSLGSTNLPQGDCLLKKAASPWRPRFAQGTGGTSTPPESGEVPVGANPGPPLSKEIGGIVECLGSDPARRHVSDGRMRHGGTGPVFSTMFDATISSPYSFTVSWEEGSGAGSPEHVVNGPDAQGLTENGGDAARDVQCIAGFKPLVAPSPSGGDEMQLPPGALRFGNDGKPQLFPAATEGVDIGASQYPAASVTAVGNEGQLKPRPSSPTVNRLRGSQSWRQSSAPFPGGHEACAYTGSPRSSPPFSLWNPSRNVVESTLYGGDLPSEQVEQAEGVGDDSISQLMTWSSSLLELESEKVCDGESNDGTWAMNDARSMAFSLSCSSLSSATCGGFFILHSASASARASAPPWHPASPCRPCCVAP